jgi:hypothetical protein
MLRRSFGTYTALCYIMYFKTIYIFFSVVMFGVAMGLGERKLISVYYSSSCESEIKSPPTCVAEQLHNTTIICCYCWVLMGVL